MITKHLISTAAREYPDHVAIVSQDRRLTFTEVHDRVNRLAHSLIDLGLKKGDRVGILLRNCVEFIETDFALSKAGLVRVTLNYRLAGRDHAYILNDSASRALIFGEEFSVEVELIKNQLKSTDKFICVPGKKAVQHLPGFLDYNELVAAGSPDDPKIEIHDQDLRALTYTSGTTGNPKGVMLTERAWVSTAIAIMLNYGPMGEKDVILSAQPLSHGAGFFVLPFFIRGGANVIAEFDPSRIFETVEKERVTVLKLVPVMLYKLLDSPDKHLYDLSSLTHIIYGGSPIARQRLEEAIRFFGGKLSQLYGQAELPMCISTLSRQDHRLEGSEEEVKRLESAGKACINVQLKIVDENGREVPSGQPGEVVARGDHVMKGYWKLDEATAATIRDGWVHTGDIGYLDSKGFLFLLDRKKDMIISGAFNIYPAEVERIIITHPAVQEVTVIGVPDEKWGEAVKAVVVLKPGARATQAEIIGYGKEMGLGFRAPKSVDFTDQIPRNPYGKVDKKSLRNPYWESYGKKIH